MTAIGRFNHVYRTQNTYKARAKIIFNSASWLNLTVAGLAIVGASLEIATGKSLIPLLMAGTLSLGEMNLTRRLNGAISRMNNNHTRGDLYDPIELRNKSQKNIYKNMTVVDGIKPQVHSLINGMYGSALGKAVLSFGTAALLYNDSSVGFAGVAMVLGFSIRQEMKSSDAQWAHNYLGDNKINRPRPAPRAHGYSNHY